MVPYAARQIDSEDLKLFEEIRELLSTLPDTDLGRDDKGEEVILSCHILAEAVGQVFDLKVTHGAFLGFREHGWVETSRGNIIDLYPIAAVGGPVMYDGKAPILPRRLFPYLRDEEQQRRYEHMLQTEWFRKAVRIVASRLYAT